MQFTDNFTNYCSQPQHEYELNLQDIKARFKFFDGGQEFYFVDQEFKADKILENGIANGHYGNHSYVFKNNIFSSVYNPVKYKYFYSGEDKLSKFMEKAAKSNFIRLEDKYWPWTKLVNCEIIERKDNIYKFNYVFSNNLPDTGGPVKR